MSFFNYMPLFNISMPFGNFGANWFNGGSSFCNFFNPVNCNCNFFSANYFTPLYTNFDLGMNSYQPTFFQSNQVPFINFANIFTRDNSKNSVVKSNNIAISTKNVNNSYYSLSPSAAWDKALSDSKLEKLSGGSYYTVANTFYFKGKNTGYTDIPFARKGTSEILNKIGKELNVSITVTSALATNGANSPHIKGRAKSHHNANNPKLDFAIPKNMSSSEFAQKLKNTGYFSHVLNEGDHIDVQIAENAYTKFQALA